MVIQIGEPRNSRCDGGTRKARPVTLAEYSCHTRHVFCSIYANSACSIQPNVKDYVKK